VKRARRVSEALRELALKGLRVQEVILEIRERQELDFLEGQETEESLVDKVCKQKYCIILQI
jgi:hypothetical protein